uniref:ATP-dependent RNA helicase DHX36 n=1 Tax=Syphacia muris TaxID=451379 RepID=A0A0N5A918_9BILA
MTSDKRRIAHRIINAMELKSNSYGLVLYILIFCSNSFLLIYYYNFNCCLVPHDKSTESNRVNEPMLIPPKAKETPQMRALRMSLPTYALKKKIVSAIESHKVTLITGGTGCGKTTQVPQFLLEHACANHIPIRIICTQPRRLPTIAVAERVARERNERVGGTVGYHIRLEQKTSPQTILTYCTSGVLLRMLTVDGVARSMSHIFLDEIHEREQNTDYLLIALKQALKVRDNLKVILMSATMEGNLRIFKDYFKDSDVAHVNGLPLFIYFSFHLIIFIFVFFFLIFMFMCSCSYRKINIFILGSILVFLPGYEDILTQMHRPCYNIKPQIYTLHSQMNCSDQQKVFDAAPPGYRKVILSTNIAEASLTIDDVVFVIDSGKVKEKSYDHLTRINQLKVTWIAKSNAEQRSGRAGRCQAGYCFRLYSADDYERMEPTQIAEMKKAAIHDVCLHAKMYAPPKMPVKDFLALAPEPPSSNAVEWSLEFLEVCIYKRTLKLSQADCYNSLERPLKREPDLTYLGRHIAQLPLDPQLARLLLFGTAFKCFNPTVTLVATLSHREPFVLPLGEERNAAIHARDEFGRCDYSDHLMFLRAFYAYQRMSDRSVSFCRTHFLSPNTMRMISGIRRQLVYELRRLRIIAPNCNAFEDPELNRYSNCWPVLQAVIVAGCYPGIGSAKSGNKLRKIRTSTEASATLHPGCIIKRQIVNPCHLEEPKIDYLAFQELSKIDDRLTVFVCFFCVL